jgi:methanogenesis imperfect marker protein 11
MSEVYTPEQLRERSKGKKWIMPYTRLTTLVDPRTQEVLYIEEYGPKEGIFVEGWRALHYPLTSRLVKKTYREGAATISWIAQGTTKLKLKPSFAPIGISECAVGQKKVHLTFEGVGGAGVSASFSRGMAEGVEWITVHNEGGGAKKGSSTITAPRQSLLLIGVDDTDNETTGATYALVDTIAKEICQIEGLRYLLHVNVQLYPYNKLKTRNCFSTVIGVVYQTDAQKKKVINFFAKELKQHTVSDHTAMAVFEGFSMSDGFIDYCTSLKFRMATDLVELKELALASGVEIYPITGDRGLFGAIGALGYWDRPDFAAKLPSQCL